MDLETENRIAAMLLKEAAELRRQAENEGSLAYIRQPTPRSRPNSRFLTATVRGVQQANRVVEVNELWRLREKQLELDNRIRGTRDESRSRRSYKDVSGSHRSNNREVEPNTCPSQSSIKRTNQDLHLMEDEGLRDDEVEEFLQSRTKRGRGAVGSRVEETGPYLPSTESERNHSANSNEYVRKVVLGPEKPFSLKSTESSDDESFDNKKKKAKKMDSSKRHSKKHKSKDKKKKKRKDEKRRKHDK